MERPYTAGMTATPAAPRYPALESLRGLAACAVVFHHCLLALPALYPYDAQRLPWARVLTNTPLHLLWDGYAAVLLFFLLSGFVLTLGVWEGRPLRMGAFLIRRIWRIWVPFVPVVALAFVAAWLLGASPLSGVSTWFNRIWVGADAGAFAEHLLMLNKMDTLGSSFIPVVWTLKYEMWLSLLLPVVLLLARQRWWLALLLVAALNDLGHSPLLSGVSGDTFHRILQFLMMFVVGALLARHHRPLLSWIRQRSEVVSGLLLMLAGGLGCLTWWLPSVSEQSTRGDLAVTAGAALLVALALGWPRLQGLLLLGPLRWLGQVSFSVYLWHTLVLTVLVRLEVFSLWLSLLLVLPLTLLIAGVYHRYVEQPAAEMGRRLSAPRAAQEQVPHTAQRVRATRP